jgi:hypothetical protein
LQEDKPAEAAGSNKYQLGKKHGSAIKNVEARLIMKLTPNARVQSEIWICQQCAGRKLHHLPIDSKPSVHGLLQ